MPDQGLWLGFYRIILTTSRDSPLDFLVLSPAGHTDGYHLMVVDRNEGGNSQRSILARLASLLLLTALPILARLTCQHIMC